MKLVISDSFTEVELPLKSNDVPSPTYIPVFKRCALDQVS
jgi:hypothetical protein